MLCPDALKAPVMVFFKDNAYIYYNIIYKGETISLMRNNSRRHPEESAIPDYIRENIEKEKRIGIMISEIKKELKTNPAYKEFFEQYHPSSIDSFIDNYALKKTRYMTYGEMLKKNEENAFLRRQTEAEERLWEIQRKKLFNLECQWRAEMIRIPGVELTIDFEFWEKNIEICPFLDPITEDDFELYLEYLLSPDFSDFDLSFSWMGYNEVKESLKEDESIPPWYEFYDMHKGTGSLMMLPDIRGEKEEYYLSVYRKNKSSRQKASPTPLKVPNATDTRPFLHGHDLERIEEFIRQFEGNKLLEYYQLYEKELNASNDDLEQALSILKSAEEKVPVDPSEDWRLAIITAARRYEQKKLGEACRVAYSQYVYRKNIGIAHEVHSSEENIKWVQEWTQQIRENIIQARISLGEPADLNF